MAPISAQKSMVLMCSAETPCFGPSRPSIQPPIRKPIAMPRPCGEMAKLSPMRIRSRTGQPMEARSGSTTCESTGGRSNGRATGGPRRDRAATRSRRPRGSGPPRRRERRRPKGRAPTSPVRAIAPEAEVARRDRGERGQDGRMAAGPRRAVRRPDQQTRAVAVGLVRPRTVRHALQTLAGEPGHAGRAERARGRAAASHEGEHARRPRRGPERPELRDPGEEPIGLRTVSPIQHARTAPHPPHAPRAWTIAGRRRRRRQAGRSRSRRCAASWPSDDRRRSGRPRSRASARARHASRPSGTRRPPGCSARRSPRTVRGTGT